MCTKLNDILFNVKVFCSNFKTFLCIYVFCVQKTRREADNYSQFPRLSLYSIKLLTTVSLPANDLPE